LSSQFVLTPNEELRFSMKTPPVQEVWSKFVSSLWQKPSACGRS